MIHSSAFARLLSGAAMALTCAMIPLSAHAASPTIPPPPALTPFTGTATLSYTARDQLVPAGARSDLSVHSQTETFAVRNATHWRVDTHVTSPALQSEDETIVSDGTQIVTYGDADASASRLPDGVAESSMFLSLMLQSQSLPVGSTTAQYLALPQFNHQIHVQSQGQAQVAGETADILKISPVGSGESSSCNASGACVTKHQHFGSELVWLDHAHGVVLRLELHGVKKMGMSNFRYAVTSIAFGVGPSDSDLAFTPPVPVRAYGENQTTSTGMSGGPHETLQAPPGLIAVANPAIGTESSILSGSSFGSSEGMGMNSTVAVGLFRIGGGSGYVYLEERFRVNGLPASLTSGTPQHAGSCTAYTGTYPDGVRWLALARGDVSVLVATNSLSTSQLVHYAATGICAAPVVKPPTAKQARATALMEFETEIDITREILSWAIATAPDASTRSALQGYDTRLQALDRTVWRLQFGSRPYQNPTFEVQHHTFKQNLSSLVGEIQVARYQLANAESVVTPVQKQTLVQQGSVFDDLSRAATSMG